MMPETPPPIKRADRASVFRRPWVWLVSTGAAGFVLLALAVTAMYLRISPNLRDLPDPPDDTALRVVREEIPDEENAFHYFVKAVNHSFITGEQYLRYGETIAENVWDEELARQIIQSNSKAMEYVKQGAQQLRGLAPQPETLYDGPVYDLERRKDLEKILHVYPRLLVSEGRETEALSFCVEQARLGNALMRSKGVIIDYLVGVSVQSEALDSLMEIANTSGLKAEDFHTLPAEIASLHDKGDALSDAVKEEYAMTLRSIDSQIKEIHGFDPSEQSPTRRAAWIYHPNRTKKKISDYFISLVENADKPYSRTEMNSIYTIFDEDSSTVSIMLSPNTAGEFSIATLLHAFDKIHLSKCRANSIVAVAQTLMAAIAFEKTTGALPDTLDELLPIYIESVPLDNFDGRPIRYDAERKIVYSIGKDLVDDGGDESNDLVWAIGGT